VRGTRVVLGSHFFLWVTDQDCHDDLVHER